MTEVELYKELGALTKSREKWKENIPYVSSLLTGNHRLMQTANHFPDFFSNAIKE